MYDLMLKKKACKFLVLLFAVISLAGFGGKTSHAQCCVVRPKPILVEGRPVVITPVSVMIRELEKEIERDIQKWSEKVSCQFPRVRCGILRLKHNFTKKINEAIKEIIRDNININIVL